MRELLPILKHPQYIRIDNKPLVLMTEGWPPPKCTPQTETYANIADERGRRTRSGGMKAPGGDPIATEGCGPDGLLELVLPEGSGKTRNAAACSPGTNPEVRMHDYRRPIERAMKRDNPLASFFGRFLRTSIPAIRTLTRSPSSTHHPLGYQEWLENVCVQTERLFDSEERLVFIQGWNSAHTRGAIWMG